MKNNKVLFINRLLTWFAFLTDYLNKPRAVDNPLISCIVVYSTTALGDLLLNTPAIYALKTRYSQARMILVSSPKNRQLVQGSDIFDEVIYWNNKVSNIIYFIIKLRLRRPQIAFILHSHFPYDILSATLAGCRAIYRDHYGNERPELNRWLSGYSSHFEGHTVQRKLNLVGQLGCDTRDIRMRIPVPIPTTPRVGGGLRIGYQLGASRAIRRWPLEHFAALTQAMMAQNPQLEVVLIGGANEQALAEALMALLPGVYRARLVSVVGKTDLIQLSSTIKCLDLLVTGDTGPLHLAIAQQVRTISLFVTANPLYTGPYQDLALHKVFYRPFASLPPELANQPYPMGVISPDEVFDAIKQLFPDNFAMSLASPAPYELLHEA